MTAQFPSTATTFGGKACAELRVRLRVQHGEEKATKRSNGYDALGAQHCLEEGDRCTGGVACRHHRLLGSSIPNGIGSSWCSRTAWNANGVGPANDSAWRNSDCENWWQLPNSGERSSLEGLSWHRSIPEPKNKSSTSPIPDESNIPGGLGCGCRTLESHNGAHQKEAQAVAGIIYKQRPGTASPGRCTSARRFAERPQGKCEQHGPKEPLPGEVLPGSNPRHPNFLQSIQRTNASNNIHRSRSVDFIDEISVIGFFDRPRRQVRWTRPTRSFIFTGSVLDPAASRGLSPSVAAEGLLFCLKTRAFDSSLSGTLARNATRMGARPLDPEKTSVRNTIRQGSEVSP